MDICPEYFPKQCSRLEVSPHVCNGCSKQDSCTYERYYYIASYAHNVYMYTLIASREGINQSPENVQELDDLISPLLKKGQSIAHVLANHSDDINCSHSTIYRYVNDGVITARNGDLPRKVRYKPRKTDNTYKLTKEEKLAVLTLLFRSCNLMLAILLKEKTQSEVIIALNNLCEQLGIELFKLLFPVLLTDRGYRISLSRGIRMRFLWGNKDKSILL